MINASERNLNKNIIIFLLDPGVYANEETSMVDGTREPNGQTKVQKHQQRD